MQVPTTPVSPIVFFEPDSDLAHEALSNALKTTPQDAMILGLIVKYDEKNRIVNWEFATPDTVKSLALALASSNDPSTPSKES